LPAEDDGSRDDALLCLNMPSCPGHRHDFDAPGAASTRIVVGVGAQSANMMAGWAAAAVAERLGIAPVTFPGGQDGFLGGEFGGMGEPDLRHHLAHGPRRLMAASVVTCRERVVQPGLAASRR
jgi:hypothetical protein